MLYDFKCPSCECEFQVRQDMLTKHKANCPKCDKSAQRIFTSPDWVWAGSAYRPDGSLRQDKDYAEVMRG